MNIYLRISQNESKSYLRIVLVTYNILCIHVGTILLKELEDISMTILYCEMSRPLTITILFQKLCIFVEHLFENHNKSNHS